MVDRANHEGPNTRRRLSSRTISESNRSLDDHSHSSTVVCHITQPNNNVFQVEVDSRAEVKSVIDKVCKQLGIINEEAEYLGLQYSTNKNEMIWLNNRNRLSKQMPRSPPYQLYVKVKYFVQPHFLLLEETRYLFYISAVHYLKNGTWDAETSIDVQAHAIALMAYAQFGKYNKDTSPCRYACFWPDSRGEISAEVIQMAAEVHKQLEGCTTSKTRYDLLQLVSKDVTSYGTHFYDVKDIFDHRLLLGVGPENIMTCLPSNIVKDRFPYCRVNKVTTSHRIVILDLLEDDGSVQARHYKLGSPRLADSLYRLITEVHAFFRCDSVPRHVLQQTTRDLKDTIVAIFDHNDKAFAFDVMHTGREVYDRARRHLYNCSNSTAASTPVSSNCAGHFTFAEETVAVASEDNLHVGDANGDCQESANYVGLKRNSSGISESLVITSNELKCLLSTRLRELTLCRLCMDNSIDRVFIPCGHAICCEQCAQMVECCSVCRAPIENRQAFFLPVDLGTVLQQPIPRRIVRRRSVAIQPCNAGTCTDDYATKSPSPVSLLNTDSSPISTTTTTVQVSWSPSKRKQQVPSPIPVPSSCNMISHSLTSYLTSRSSSTSMDTSRSVLINRREAQPTVTHQQSVEFALGGETMDFTTSPLAYPESACNHSTNTVVSPDRSVTQLQQSTGMQSSLKCSVSVIRGCSEDTSTGDGTGNQTPTVSKLSGVH